VSAGTSRDLLIIDLVPSSSEGSSDAPRSGEWFCQGTRLVSTVRFDSALIVNLGGCDERQGSYQDLGLILQLRRSVLPHRTGSCDR
jgi:hypothetical protein